MVSDGLHEPLVYDVAETGPQFEQQDYQTTQQGCGYETATQPQVQRTTSLLYRLQKVSFHYLFFTESQR